jgi:heme exporter protein D
MMPDLGAYATTVLLSYGVSVVLLGGLIATTLVRSARVRRDLAEAEEARRRRHAQ